MFSHLADYHVHTPLCHHAASWPVEFAARAVEMGLGELGFADHNPMPEQFDEWRMSRDELPRYLDEVARAPRSFRGGQKGSASGSGSLDRRPGIIDGCWVSSFQYPR